MKKKEKYKCGCKIVKDKLVDKLDGCKEAKEIFNAYRFGLQLQESLSLIAYNSEILEHLERNKICQRKR